MDGLCASDADGLGSNERFAGAAEVVATVVADTRKARVLARCLNVLYHLEGVFCEIAQCLSSE